MDKAIQKIDHLMWDAEAPNSLPTIAGILVFEHPLNKQNLINVVSKRLFRYERFKKKVILKDGKPMWHEDEKFDLQTHFHHIHLPDNGGYTELQECVSQLISQPLNHNKPLWDVHLIDNYKNGSAVLWRLHHAIGDGMSLVKVVYSLTGNSAKDSLTISGRNRKSKTRKSTGKKEHLAESEKSVFDDAMQLLSNPALLRDTIETNWQTVMEIGELFFGKPVTNTIYKGQLGAAKKAAWTKPLSLVKIKTIAKYYKVKMNDVLVALVAGAIRAHLRLHRQKLGKGMKVVVPINIRKKDDLSDVDNEFSWISLDLPVHIKDFEKRLKFIRKKTAVLKPSAETLFLHEMLHIVADYIPQPVKQMFLEFMGNHIAGVITNMPGPEHPIYFAGEKVEDLTFWVPHTVPLGIGISLMSYDGKVYMGIVTDEGLVNDPDTIVNAFADELNQVEKVILPIG